MHCFIKGSISDFTKGVRQRCNRSPLLFNMYFEGEMKKETAKLINYLTIQQEKITMIRFPDDIVLFAEERTT